MFSHFHCTWKVFTERGVKQERDIKDQKISSICWYSLQIGTSWKTADWNFIQVAYLSNEDPNSCAISAAKWDSQGGRRPGLLAGNSFSMLAVLEDLHPKSGPQAKQGIFLCILAEPIIIDCIVSWSERSLHSVLFPEKPLPCMPLARCLFCLQFNCWISVHWERSPVTYDTAYSGAH